MRVLCLHGAREVGGKGLQRLEAASAVRNLWIKVDKSFTKEHSDSKRMAPPD
jgi:hypothetical protein